jgi:hypothetical protein
MQNVIICHVLHAQWISIHRLNQYDALILHAMIQRLWNRHVDWFTLLVGFKDTYPEDYRPVSSKAAIQSWP